MGFIPKTQASYAPSTIDGVEPTMDDGYAALSASDLASILKWSQEVSRDINLSTGAVAERSLYVYPY